MGPGRYDFWLVDLDGTIVDVEPGYARSVLERVGDRLGVALSDRDVDDLWHGLGGPRNDLLRRRGIDPEEFWDAFHDVEDPRKRAGSTFLYDDAALIGELDVPVGLVTHCQDYLTGPVLERLDIRDWFDAVVCCTSSTGWKPDPGPVRLAARELGVALADGPRPAPGTAAGVLAGDGPQDVGAAWNAGLDSIHVERHGPDRRGQCVLGDHRVGSFAELTG